MYRELLTLGICVFISSAWASLPIRLDADSTLVPIFETGLRPSNLLGAETTTCWIPKVPAVELSILGVKLPVAEGEMRINVDDSNRLRRVTIIDRRNMSLEEVDKIAIQYHEALNVPMESWRQFMANRGTRQRSDYYRLVHRIRPDIFAGFYLIVSFDDNRPFQMATEIEWMRPDSQWSPRSSPIKAPHGFESWDMSPNLQSYARGFKTRDPHVMVPMSNSENKIDGIVGADEVQAHQKQIGRGAEEGKISLVIIVASLMAVCLLAIILRFRSRWRIKGE